MSNFNICSLTFQCHLLRLALPSNLIYVEEICKGIKGLLRAKIIYYFLWMTLNIQGRGVVTSCLSPLSYRRGSQLGCSPFTVHHHSAKAAIYLWYFKTMFPLLSYD
ncbi:hypothetical protein GDO81_009295 [Engystomops pustulosus]|uniref:Uncharacterized protein n=1 Tax=Engystomops pustulosus TaxID=76066 RepID=A0AAV7BPW2_ENGPU|nr:hypothetical protein GDO81_009295 [Engystomops pustulosus]